MTILHPLTDVLASDDSATDDSVAYPPVSERQRVTIQRFVMTAPPTLLLFEAVAA